VELAPGKIGVPLVEREGFEVDGACERNEAGFKEKVGLIGFSSPGLYWTRESTGVSKDAEGYELDKQEVNAELSGFETNGGLVHIDVVGVRHPGVGCTFGVVVLP
jgi:hypothetical protein